MLLAAGLSPAWQQIVLLDALRLGEVNRAKQVRWCASGKVLNVGLAMHRLSSGQAKTLSFLGGPAAESIEREFAAESVSRRWVFTEAPTRVCTTVIDESRKSITELVENARPVFPPEVGAFREAYRQETAIASVVVLTGSHPAGVDDTFFAELLAATPCRAILDIRGLALDAALPSRPFLVKPNREELAQTVGRPLDTDAEVLAAARQIVDAGAEWVLISQGRDPALLVSSTRQWRATPPEMPVVNPIGSGDCLAAGLAWGLSQGLDVPQSLRLGMAAAALNVSTLLPARFDAAMVRETAARVDVLEFQI